MYHLPRQPGRRRGVCGRRRDHPLPEPVWTGVPRRRFPLDPRARDRRRGRGRFHQRPRASGSVGHMDRRDGFSRRRRVRHSPRIRLELAWPPRRRRGRLLLVRSRPRHERRLPGAFRERGLPRLQRRQRRDQLGGHGGLHERGRQRLQRAAHPARPRVRVSRRPRRGRLLPDGS